MTREEIEQLDNTEPYSFETDREEWWYKIGLKEGLETADQNPRKGLWDAKKVCAWIGNHLLTSHQGYILEDLRKAMED